MNVLCIADQDHLSSDAVNHSSKLEDIYLIVNPLHMRYNTENEAALQKLPEKPHDKGKPKNKMFSKNTRANRPEPSAQSE